MRLVPTLYVEFVDGTLRYRLEVPERDVGEPLQEEFNHRVDRSTLLALQRSAEAALRRPESPNFVDEARTRGSVLYRTLIPAPLRPQLAAVAGPLLVSTSLYGLPWELLHDDEEFWGLRYALGKRLVLDRRLTLPGGARFRPRPRALIIGSDPRGDLPFVAREVEAICDTLAQFSDICCVSGGLATFDTITGHLSEAFDLIHYSGHVVTDDRAGPALLLAEETLLSAAVIEANVAGRPLVFLNGCASVRGGDEPPAVDWEQGVASVAHGFLFGGAVAAVGTLSDVSDRHAATVAEQFYRRVLESGAIGEALRGAREHCRSDPTSADSPSWLSFVLYGNPGQVLRGSPGGAVAPRRSSAPALPPPAGRGAAVPTSRTVVRRRPNYFLAVAVLILGVAGGLAYYVREAAAPRARHSAALVIGVMEVQARSGAVPPWMREITRDGLNTILSQVSGIRVYSRQKIDFLREKRGLSEIEAAETLGMSKMISATLSISDPIVGLEAQVVDISSGLLVASERVQGPKGQLISMQNEIALRTLQDLGIDTTSEKLNAILKDRTNDTLESYRLLFETLGVAGGATERTVSPPDRQSTCWSCMAVAYADDSNPDETAIRSLLREYEAALGMKNIDELATLQIGMDQEQRHALLRYFGNASGLAVHITDVDVLIEGDEAVATFTREDLFTDVHSGRKMHLQLRITGVLAKQDQKWKIRGLRKPS